MRFSHNPFTDKLDISGMGPGGTSVDFLTGNDGIPVGADAGYNINVLGNNTQGINITGNAGTNTVTVAGIDATTSQKGVQANATNAQSAAQSSSTVSLTPSNITSLFSSNYLPASQGGTGLSSPSAHQLLATNGSSAFTALGVATNGQIPIGSVGSNPVLATITQGTGILVTNGPGTITISAIGAGMTWNTISASQTLVVNNGYICVSPGGALSLSLPATSILGDEIEITLDGATSFTITQSASQQIKIANTATTAGVGGSIASTQQGDTIRLVCQTPNLKWNVLSAIGNLTIV